MSQQASKSKEPVLNSSSVKARKPRKAKQINLDGVDFYGTYDQGCIEYVSAAEEREIISNLAYAPSAKFDY